MPMAWQPTTLSGRTDRLFGTQFLYGGGGTRMTLSDFPADFIQI